MNQQHDMIDQDTETHEDDRAQRTAIGTDSFGTSQAMDVLFLLTFSTLVSLWGLCAGPTLGNHEAIVAQGARQIRQGGDWLIPHVNDVPFVRKPPLSFWLVGAASLVVDSPEVQPPVSVFAARLPSAVAAILTTLLVYLLGRTMFGHRIGVICGGVMTSCAGALFYSHNAQVEMVLTLFCTASFALFWYGTHASKRRRTIMALFWASFALAMLAKAPLPMGTVALPLLVWWFVMIPLGKLSCPLGSQEAAPGVFARFRQQVRGLGKLGLLSGLLVFALVFLPWPIYVYTRIENVLDLWRLEFIARYTGDLYANVKPFWYYIPLALAFLFPFSLSLPNAFASVFSTTYERYRPGLLYCFTWAAVIIVFLSTSAFKSPRYLIAIIPPCALLLGPTLNQLFVVSQTRPDRKSSVTMSVPAILVPLALLFGGFWVAHEQPEMLFAYIGASVILSLGVIASTVGFVKNCRIFSLAVLNVSMVLCFCWLWNYMGQSRLSSRQVLTLADELRTKSIGADDNLNWTVGRPNASLIYYLGREIKPLFSPLELASRRSGRKSVPREILEEGVDRMTQRLSSVTEEYFIIPDRYWTQLKEEFDLPAREVLRVDGDGDTDTLVLITNDWNTGEEEDHLHTKSPELCQLTFP